MGHTVEHADTGTKGSVILTFCKHSLLMHIWVCLAIQMCNATQYDIIFMDYQASIRSH
jgi:hypothetical protein